MRAAGLKQSFARVGRVCRCLDVRYATRSAFKDIKVSRRCSSERHKLSAAWAMRRPWRVFARVFVAHGRKQSSNRNVVRSRPAAALAHQCGNGEVTNTKKIAIAFVFLVTTVTGTIGRAGRRVYQTYTQGVLVLCQGGVLSGFPLQIDLSKVSPRQRRGVSGRAAD